VIKTSDIPIRLLITVLILIVLEVIASAFLPLFGLNRYMIPFNVLIVLYIGFKLETPYLAIIILILQLTHSLFSIEGWEYGTIAGVLICIVISYLRDILHFSNAVMTMLTVQIFQLVWFCITASLLYLKFDSSDYILQKFWRFIPESIVLSLLAPVFFSLLDKIWKVRSEGLMRESL